MLGGAGPCCLCVLMCLHILSPHSPQLFMIPEVREGVVQFDQCAELFEDPEDDDEKPLLPAGPSNRKDETGEVRGQYFINHPLTMIPTPPHLLSFILTTLACDPHGILASPRCPPPPELARPLPLCCGHG